MSQTTVAGPTIATRQTRGSDLRHSLQRWLGRDWITAYIFVAPTVLLLGALIAWPLANAVYLSFTNTTTLQTGPFVGLQNYRMLLEDPIFRKSVWNTVIYTFWSVFFKFWIGLTAAMLIKRTKRWGNLLTGMILLPWIVPSVVVAITWRSLLDPVYGGVNQFLIQTGIVEKGFPWLGAVQTAMPSVIMVNVWLGVPFFTTMMLAGLSAINQEYYEAARIDGANAFRCFLHVTLPGLRYVIIVAVLLSSIWTFNSFTEVYLLTNGGPAGATRLYSILSWEYAINGLRFGMGVAVATIMTPILAIFIFILGRYMTPGGRVEEGRTTNSGAGQSVVSVITWPFRMAGKAFMAILTWIINLGETIVGGFMRGFSRIFVGEDPERKSRAHKTGAAFGNIMCGVVLTIIVLFELIPFYWVVITAFKTSLQWTMFESVFWPKPWTLEQFEALLGPTRSFALWYRNTIAVALVSTVVAVGVAALGAYGLTRLKWRGANVFASLVLVAYLIPAVLMFIPMYQIFATLGLTNKLLGLMVAYPAFALPFALWLMMGYYASIPSELEEAGLIDGCNHFQAWWRIILPLAAPALMAAGLFAITLAWKEFLFAYVFISKEKLFTLSVGLAQMIIGDVMPWGELMAAALLMAIPVVIIYSFANRFMVAGLTAGSVKG